MIFSRGVTQKFILALTALMMTACFKPGTHDSAESTATFYMEIVHGESQVSSTSNEWDLPTSRTYSFNVVVRDVHSTDAVKNHDFSITDTSGHIIVPHVKTNGDGTLTWSEVIGINYLADAKYIPITRIVTAIGLHSGKRTLQIALNPWYERHRKNMSKDVVDLSRVVIPESQIVSEQESALYLMGERKKTAATRRLYIDGALIQISQKGPSSTKGNATVRLEMTPQIILHDLFGNPEGIGLQKAKFRIEAHLISRIGEGDQSKRYLLGSTASEKPQQLFGDRVRFELDLNQTWGSSVGQIELAIRLIPDHGPADLKEFDGVFLIGNYSQSIGFGGFVPDPQKITDDYTFNVPDYLNKNVVNLAAITPEARPAGIFAMKAYMFGFLQPQFTQINPASERPYSRLTNITFKTVVTNPMAQQANMGWVYFCITGIDGKTKHVHSIQTGELNWTDSLEFKTYGFRHYFESPVIIRAVGPEDNACEKPEDPKAFKETFTIRVNPWAKFGFALGMDNRQISDMDANKMLTENGVIPTQQQMGKVVLAFNQNPIYAVNPDLTVEPYKSFIINLAPYVMSPTDPIDGVESAVAFRDGFYLLKVGVVAVVDGQRHVTTFKKLVNMRNSQINEPIRLHVPDLRQMRIRNLLYVEFHAVDYDKLDRFLIMTKGRAASCPDGELICGNNLDDIILKDSGLEDRTFVGLFTPFASKSEGPLRPSDDLDEVFELHNQIQNFLTEDGLKKLKDATVGDRSKVKNPAPELKEDNMNSAFHGEAAYTTMMKDPAFKNGGKFPPGNNSDILKFITRSRNQYVTPVTVADLEKEEKETNQVRAAKTQSMVSKDNFVKNTNSEYIPLAGVSETLTRFPGLKNNNQILPVAGGASRFIQLLNSNDYEGLFSDTYRNSLYPDKDLPLFTGSNWNKLQEWASNSVDKITGGKRGGQDGYFFQFNAKEINKLLPQLEPLNDEYKENINNILLSYKDTRPDADNSNIGFDFPAKQIRTGVGVGKMAATRLCSFWFNTMFKEFKHFDKIQSMTAGCINQVMETQNMDDIFVLDQKIRVLEQGRFIMDHGYFTRLNIGSDVRAGFGQSNSQSESFSISPLRYISFLPDFLFSSVSYTWYQKNASQDISQGKSSNVGAGTPISTEEAKFYMIIKAYERCSIIRMNPTFVLSQKLPQYFEVADTDTKRMEKLGRGVMICTGQREETPFLVPESFYYMTPDPFDGSELEISDHRNYPWAIGFRGPRDYTQFFNMLVQRGVQSYGGPGYSYAQLMGKEMSIEQMRNSIRPVDANQRPTAYIDQGIRDFKNSTGGVMTTYPGVYTVP